MGHDKWLLPVGGTPVLGRVVRTLDGVADEFVIVLPYDAGDELRARADAAVRAARPIAPVRWLADAEPDSGPLAGLEAAYEAGIGEWCLATAADVPFASSELAEALFRRCIDAGTEAAVPERGGRRHPLFAVYAAGAGDRLRYYRRQGGRRAMEWLDGLRVLTMRESETARYDPEGTALFNMNTPEDYVRAQSIVDGGRFRR